MSTFMVYPQTEKAAQDTFIFKILSRHSIFETILVELSTPGNRHTGVCLLQVLLFIYQMFMGVYLVPGLDLGAWNNSMHRKEEKSAVL